MERRIRMHGSPARGRIARLVALVLLLQGLVGGFARLPATTPFALEICTGEGVLRLAPPSDGPPAAPERASCLLCLLPVSLAAPEPAAVPLPADCPLGRVPLEAASGPASAPFSSSWPRAPPRGC